jgi:uncharacterized protein YbjT (DUF2867 family)
MSKKTYSIMGATGHIGHVLAEKLLEKGHKVRALGRDPGKLSALKAKGAEPLSPAFDDVKGLAAAFQGADGVFVMIPPNYGADDFAAFQDKAGEAIAQALALSGVQYAVFLSSVGADKPSGTGPIAALYRQEQRLNKLPGINVLHLRPTSFMENNFFSIPVIKGNGINGSAGPADMALPTVATRDIGEKAAEFLDKLSFKGHEVFEFTGPKEYTLSEVTAALGKAIGKPDLKYVQFPYEDVQKGLLGSGLKPKMVEMMMEMYRAGNEGKIRPTQALTAEHRGKTPIEEFAPVFAAAYQQG